MHIVYCIDYQDKVKNEKEEKAANENKIKNDVTVYDQDKDKVKNEKEETTTTNEKKIKNDKGMYIHNSLCSYVIETC